MGTWHVLPTQLFLPAQPAGGAQIPRAAGQTDRSPEMFPYHEVLSRARIRRAPELRYRAVPRPARIITAEAAARRSRQFRG